MVTDSLFRFQNQMHGKGTYRWNDGRKYEGEYQYDKKHGHGIYTWADGRQYDGSWANGLRNGRGKYILRNGSFREGIWFDDKRVKWVDENTSPEKTPGSEKDDDFDVEIRTEAKQSKRNY